MAPGSTWQSGNKSNAMIRGHSLSLQTSLRLLTDWVAAQSARAGFQNCQTSWQGELVRWAMSSGWGWYHHRWDVTTDRSPRRASPSKDVAVHVTSYQYGIRAYALTHGPTIRKYCGTVIVTRWGCDFNECSPQLPPGPPYTCKQFHKESSSMVIKFRPWPWTTPLTGNKGINLFRYRASRSQYLPTQVGNIFAYN